MSPAPAPAAPLARLLRDLARAFAIGVVLWLPIAALAWWSTRPKPAPLPRHAHSAEFAAPAADDDRLREWLGRQSGLAEVAVARAPAGGGTRIEVRFAAAADRALSIPWGDLGYGALWSSSSGHSSASPITIHLGPQYYLSLLGATAHLGFLLLGLRWLRARRGAVAWRAHGGWLLLGAVTGGTMALALLLWQQVPAVGGSLAGAWGAALFWPPWTRVVAAVVVVTLVPLAQELFFRGAALASQPPDLSGNLRVALAYALAHVWPAAWLPGLALGLVLGGLRLRSGSLLVPLIANGVFHAAAVAWPLVTLGDPAAAFQQVLSGVGDALGK